MPTVVAVEILMIGFQMTAGGVVQSYVSSEKGTGVSLDVRTIANTTRQTFPCLNYMPTSIAWLRAYQFVLQLTVHFKLQYLVALFFLLYLMVATQDIAVV